MVLFFQAMCIILKEIVKFKHQYQILLFKTRHSFKMCLIVYKKKQYFFERHVKKELNRMSKEAVKSWIKNSTNDRKEKKQEKKEQDRKGRR